QSAADQCEREALIAVADVIAAGEEIVGIEAVVDFDDGAVDAVRERRGQGNVAAAGVIAIGRAGTGIGPDQIGLGKQIGDDRIDRASIGGNGVSDIGGRWNTGSGSFGTFFAHAFVVHEKEGLVLYDRAAQ